MPIADNKNFKEMEAPAKEDRPRAAGAVGSKSRGGPKKSDEPKYNDTDESKAQLEKIRLIEAQMKEVQQKLVGCSSPSFFFCFCQACSHEALGVGFTCPCCVRACGLCFPLPSLCRRGVKLFFFLPSR